MQKWLFLQLNARQSCDEMSQILLVIDLLNIGLAHTTKFGIVPG
jgi:hypothetical protein